MIKYYLCDDATEIPVDIKKLRIHVTETDIPNDCIFYDKKRFIIDCLKEQIIKLESKIYYRKDEND